MKNFFKQFLNLKTDQRGSMLLYVMVFGMIGFSFIVIALSGYAIFENGASLSKNNREEAFQIAEAGIAYYRWHLAHNKEDYYDGQGVTSTGPYVHNYLNKDGVAIGKFSLNIIPPPPTSTIVTIESTGWVNLQPNTKRKVRVKLGFPSLTDYAFLTNSAVWIGSSESTHGKFHSNGGIRYDGTADAEVSSAVATYVCQAVFGCSNQVKPGIWGAGGPQIYWNFPAPAQDFTAITADLAQIKADADDSGIYLSSSGANGWALTFTSSSQVIAKKVTTVNCYSGEDIGESKFTNKCYDAATYGPATTYPMPTNGKIFVEDNVWVNGTVRGHAVVATAQGYNIFINGNILYTAKNGIDTLGLMAEQNIYVPYNSPDNLEIDAALLAQNGAAKRVYYSTGANVKRNSILIYGSIITNGIWTWTWVNGSNQVISGYVNTNSTYDANLTYSPPPGFPIGSEYNLISWELLQ